MSTQRNTRIGAFKSRRCFLRESSAALALFLSLPTRARAANPGGRRIGFVDDDLNNYHSNVFLQALRGPLKTRGFEVAGCTGLKRAEGRAWAEKNGIAWFDEPVALDRVVDFYMVLAPSTPETHRELCQRVLPFKKPTYVDKTFAPDLTTARQIFALADQHGTVMQTSSALRYTNVQDEVKKLGKIEHMIAWGGGGSFAEYATHPLELLISVMGPEVTAMMRRGAGHRSQLLINFTGERTGIANVFAQTNTPFAASVTTEKVTRYVEVDSSKIFVNNLAAILDFFETRQPNVDRRETLSIMRILDAARDPRALREFIPVAGDS